MATLIGVTLAIAVMIFARIVGLDRDRAFYPVVLIVVASYYVLFATIGGNKADMSVGVLQFVLFASVAVVGFRTSLWIVAAGLAAHGIFDFFHQSFASGRGMPQWWPSFCMAFDLAAGVGLAGLLFMGQSSIHRKRAGE